MKPTPRQLARLQEFATNVRGEFIEIDLETADYDYDIWNTYEICLHGGLLLFDNLRLWKTIPISLQYLVAEGIGKDIQVSKFYIAEFSAPFHMLKIPNAHDYVGSNIARVISRHMCKATLRNTHMFRDNRVCRVSINYKRM